MAWFLNLQFKPEVSLKEFMTPESGSHSVITFSFQRSLFSSILGYGKTNYRFIHERRTRKWWTISAGANPVLRASVAPSFLFLHSPHVNTILDHLQHCLLQLPVFPLLIELHSDVGLWKSQENISVTRGRCWRAPWRGCWVEKGREMHTLPHCELEQKLYVDDELEAEKLVKWPWFWLSP